MLRGGSKVLGRAQHLSKFQPRARCSENTQQFLIIQNQATTNPRSNFTTSSPSLSPRRRSAISHLRSDRTNLPHSSSSVSASTSSRRSANQRTTNAYPNNDSRHNARRRTAVPQAYRRSEEQEPEPKLSSFNNHNNNHNNNSSSYPSRTSLTKAKKLKREITTLIRAQDQSRALLKEYTTNLGVQPPLIPTSPTKTNEDGATTVSSDQTVHTSTAIDTHALVQTEKSYSRSCVKLRQLIVGWSSIRADYGGMDTDVLTSLMDASRDLRGDGAAPLRTTTPYPAEIAYSHLVQLEGIRNQRAEFLEAARDQQQQVEEASAAAGGVMGWISKKVEGLLTATDDGRQSSGGASLQQPPSLERCKAHLSPDYTTNQLLYGEVMRSFVYWQHIPFPTTQVTSEYEDNNDKWDNDRPSISGETSSSRRRKRMRVKGSTTSQQQQQQQQSTPTNGVVLADRLDSIMSRMNQSFQSGNPNCRPLLINYQFFMKHLAFTGTMRHAIRASEVLQAMEESTTQEEEEPTTTDYPPQSIHHHHTTNPIIDSNSVVPLPCAPNVQTYNRVLKAYRSVAANRSESRHNRRRATLEAEKLLYELHAKNTGLTSSNHQKSSHQHQQHPARDNTTLEPKDKDSDVSPPALFGPSLPSYDIVVNTLYAAGHPVIPDMCDRVDKIMEQMMGKEAYLGWIGEWKTPPTSPQVIGTTTLQPDMKMHHTLIVIFSTTRNSSYIARARVLLKLVEDHNKLFSNEGEQGSDMQEKTKNIPSGWPTYRAYNSFLAGLNSLASVEVKRAWKKKQIAVNGGKYPTIESNAKFAMSLLDSMLHRDASMPNMDTFHYIMRLWSVSGSKYAGERGEELLSRMELHGACNFDELYDVMKSNHLSYEIALECWATSANAMQPGAARRALTLLERMESQCYKIDFKDDRDTKNTVQSNELTNIYNSNLSVEKETSFVYSAVIHACTLTRLNSDKDDAFRIAFDVYNRMTEHGIIPTQLIFRDLLNCCVLLPASAQKRRIQLSQTVFEAACENGCVDARVLSKLQQVNPDLHRSYEPLPEHSAALRELKRSFV